MKWIVEDSIVCPETGTVFSIIAGFRNLNLKLTIWYEASSYLSPESEILTESNETIIDGCVHDLNLMHVFPYSTRTWSKISNTAKCPGNSNNNITNCTNTNKCKLIHCPFNAR